MSFSFSADLPATLSLARRAGRRISLSQFRQKIDSEKIINPVNPVNPVCPVASENGTGVKKREVLIMHEKAIIPIAI